MKFVLAFWFLLSGANLPTHPSSIDSMMNFAGASDVDSILAPERHVALRGGSNDSVDSFQDVYNGLSAIGEKYKDKNSPEYALAVFELLDGKNYEIPEFVVKPPADLDKPIEELNLEESSRLLTFYAEKVDEYSNLIEGMEGLSIAKESFGPLKRVQELVKENKEEVIKSIGDVSHAMQVSALGASSSETGVTGVPPTVSNRRRRLAEDHLSSPKKTSGSTPFGTGSYSNVMKTLHRGDVSGARQHMRSHLRDNKRQLAKHHPILGGGSSSLSPARRQLPQAGPSLKHGRKTSDESNDYHYEVMESGWCTPEGDAGNLCKGDSLALAQAACEGANGSHQYLYNYPAGRWVNLEELEERCNNEPLCGGFVTQITGGTTFKGKLVTSPVVGFRAVGAEAYAEWGYKCHRKKFTDEISPLFQDLGDDGCQSLRPCNQCQGHCVDDTDCAEGLLCWSRGSSGDHDSNALIPSCDNGNLANMPANTNFCYLPELEDLGGSGCTASSPCGQCQGDCDSDNQCGPGLSCWRRHPTLSAAEPHLTSEVIPSCNNGNLDTMPESHDFCYLPPKSSQCKLLVECILKLTPYSLFLFFHSHDINSESGEMHIDQEFRPRVELIGWSSCSPESPCFECQGHCHNSDWCAEGLQCFKRGVGDTHLYSDPIPGCSNLYLASLEGNVDICYDPSKAVNSNFIEVEVSNTYTTVQSIAALLASDAAGGGVYNDHIAQTRCDAMLRPLFRTLESDGQLEWHGSTVGEVCLASGSLQHVKLKDIYTHQAMNGGFTPGSSDMPHFLVPLDDLGGDFCLNGQRACDRCQGDCDQNDGCGPDLTCWKRGPGDPHASVSRIPGCDNSNLGSMPEATDFCYDIRHIPMLNSAHLHDIWTSSDPITEELTALMNEIAFVPFKCASELWFGYTGEKVDSDSRSFPFSTPYRTSDADYQYFLNFGFPTALNQDQRDDYGLINLVDQDWINLFHTATYHELLQNYNACSDRERLAAFDECEDEDNAVKCMRDLAIEKIPECYANEIFGAADRALSLVLGGASSPGFICGIKDAVIDQGKPFPGTCCLDAPYQLDINNWGFNYECNLECNNVGPLFSGLNEEACSVYGGTWCPAPTECSRLFDCVRQMASEASFDPRYAAFRAYLESSPLTTDMDRTDLMQCGVLREYFGFDMNYINDDGICEEISELKYSRNFEFLNSFFGGGGSSSSGGVDGGPAGIDIGEQHVPEPLEISPVDTSESDEDIVQRGDDWLNTNFALRTGLAFFTNLLDAVSDFECPNDPVIMGTYIPVGTLCKFFQNIVIYNLRVTFAYLDAALSVSEFQYDSKCTIKDSNQMVAFDHTRHVTENLNELADWLNKEVPKIFEEIYDNRVAVLQLSNSLRQRRLGLSEIANKVEDGMTLDEISDHQEESPLSQQEVKNLKHEGKSLEHEVKSLEHEVKSVKEHMLVMEENMNEHMLVMEENMKDHMLAMEEKILQVLRIEKKK